MIVEFPGNTFLLPLLTLIISKEVTFYKILIAVVGQMIEELEQYGYRFEEGAMVLAQFFADDLGMEAELIEAMSTVFARIGEFYQFAQKSLHPDKFVLNANCHGYRLKKRVSSIAGGKFGHWVKKGTDVPDIHEKQDSRRFPLDSMEIA